MAANNNWFPNKRTDRHALISKTATFMTVGANRNAIGFESNSASGRWYDTVYSPIADRYFSKYRLWADPLTGTVVALDNLKDAEAALFPLYRRFHALVKASPVVTNGQLEETGFLPRRSGGRSSHPVDRLFISLHAVPTGNMVLGIAFENRDTGRPTVPYYLAGAAICYAVSDTPVSDQRQLDRSILATRSPAKLVFAPGERGRTVYLAARWQNRRGRYGPWSEIISAVIP
jgi:hypothetical protein